jgi:hypothetical protein
MSDFNERRWAMQQRWRKAQMQWIEERRAAERFTNCLALCAAVVAIVLLALSMKMAYV